MHIVFYNVFNAIKLFSDFLFVKCFHNIVPPMYYLCRCVRQIVYGGSVVFPKRLLFLCILSNLADAYIVEVSARLFNSIGRKAEY